MSDETPTQRFDQPGEDAPTELLPAGEPAVETETPSEKKSKRTIIILASVGGALLLALIVLVIVLLTRGSAPAPVPTDSPTPTPTASSASPSPTPTATSATPSPSPTPTQTEAPAPPPAPDTSTRVDVFTASSTEIFCNTQAPNPPSYELGFRWSVSNATQVYFGVGTTDASTGAFFTDLPTTGTQADFEYPVEFPCPQESQIYTITAVGENGTASKTVTIINVGDKQ